MIKNLIFDLDGTLIDSSEGVVEAVNHSLRQVGETERPAKEIKAFIGYPLKMMYTHFTQVPFEKLYPYFQEKANHTVISAAKMLPGVENALSKFKRDGYKMAIASTKVRQHIEAIVGKFNWDKIFAIYSGGDEVAKVKPDPAILKLTLKRLNAEVSETLVIGDTINDVLAAKAVPLKVVAVKSPYCDREELLTKQANFIIDSINDLYDLLTNKIDLKK